MKEISIIRKFVYLSLIFGILFVILIPPFQSPDEDSHFKKAYVIAEGQLYPAVVNGEKGFYLSRSIEEYISGTLESIGNLDYKFSYSEIISEEQKSITYDDRKFQQFSTMSTSPIGHIIPAIGIMVGKGVAALAAKDPSVVFLLYFARFFSLISYIVIVSLAIRITPILKTTFCIIGCMPMSLFLASSVSYDMLLIGCSFIFAALCFWLLYDDKVTMQYKHMLAFGIIAYVFLALKIIYLSIYLLLVVVLYDQYQKKNISLKRSLKNVALALTVFFLLELAISIIPDFIVSSQIQTGAGTGGMSLSQQQMHYVIKDPFGFANTLYCTIKAGRNYYISSTVGLFGLVDTPMISLVIYLFVFISILVALAELALTNVKVLWYHKIAVFVSTIIGVVGAFLAMYIYWTPLIFGVGAKTIEGVQGRYFIPFLPVAVLVLGNSFLRRRKLIKMCGVVLVENGVLLSILTLIVSVTTVILRYWIS